MFRDKIFTYIFFIPPFLERLVHCLFRMNGEKIFGNSEFGYLCPICPGKTHRHFSSARAINYSQGKPHFCPPCGKIHPLKFDKNKNLVLIGSSTLFVEFKNWKWNKNFCMLFELVGGGKIKDFQQIYEDLYSHLNLPFCFVLTAGLNDIKVNNRYQMLGLFYQLKLTIEKNKNHKCFITGMLIPPMFCLDPQDKLSPSSSIFHDIIFINKEIEKWYDTKVFSLESFGCRDRELKNGWRNWEVKPFYRPTLWREMYVKRNRDLDTKAKLRKCLHLTFEQQRTALEHLIEHALKYYV